MRHVTAMPAVSLQQEEVHPHVECRTSTATHSRFHPAWAFRSVQQKGGANSFLETGSSKDRNWPATQNPDASVSVVFVLPPICEKRVWVHSHRMEPLPFTCICQAVFPSKNDAATKRFLSTRMMNQPVMTWWGSTFSFSRASAQIVLWCSMLRDISWHITYTSIPRSSQLWRSAFDWQDVTPRRSNKRTPSKFSRVGGAAQRFVSFFSMGTPSSNWMWTSFLWQLGYSLFFDGLKRSRWRIDLQTVCWRSMENIVFPSIVRMLVYSATKTGLSVWKTSYLGARHG